MKTSAILLAGGHGSRMNSTTPKQFLNIADKPIILYSYEVLMGSPEIDEVVVVCAPEHRTLFAPGNKRVAFALPGPRRQDSVYNGFLETSEDTSYVCIHDSARPFLDRDMIVRALEGAKEVGAATVGMPLRFTIKQVDAKQHVVTTPDRSMIWEIQTPQILSRSLLVRGFAHVLCNGITVTDDVALAELIGAHVKLVEGSSNNIKITVPADLHIARHLLESHA